MIRLQGKWLQEMGFRVGDRVVVMIDAEKITITKDNGASFDRFRSL